MRIKLLLLSFLLLALPALAASPIRFGLSVQPDTGANGISSATMCSAGGAKVHFVAIRATWPRLQPAANRWNFTWLDTAVNNAVARKQEVILVLGPAPRWTVTYLNRPSPEEVLRAKPTPQSLQDYAAALAKRYGDRVHYYQVWERPVSGTLLAVARDVQALFRAAARGIHSVNPALQVIAPEPGDVNLRWIAQYWNGSQSAERPDAILLCPDRLRADPQQFNWRMQVLRGRVLPAKNGPALWASIPITQDACRWNITAAALLQDISTLIFTGNESGIQAVLPSMEDGMARLSMLQGSAYSGSCRLSPELVAGLFTRGKETTVLALPNGKTSLSLTTVDSSTDAVSVPEGDTTMLYLDGAEKDVTVKEPTTVRLAGSPVLINRAAIHPEARVLTSSPQCVEDDCISLSANGSNPLALCPLRDLPGGEYTVEAYDDVCRLATRIEVAPWIHLEVPDGFLFYNTGRVPVEVTVSVQGVGQAQKTGFYLYYDAVNGMACSRWQWIETGYDKVYTYTFRLNDALFADSEGYDLRLDMAGSSESVRLVNACIRKLPATTPPKRK